MFYPLSLTPRFLFRRFAFGAALLAVFANSFCQITITHTSFLDLGYNYTTYKSSDTVRVDLGAGGEAQVWQLPETFWNDPLEQSYIDPALTPFTTYFPQATHCLNSSLGTYGYSSLTLNAYSELGYGYYSGNQGSVVVYSSQAIAFPLPLTYPHESWSSVYEADIQASPEITTHVYDSTISVLDGYGVIVTPYGAPQTLRIFQHIFRTTNTPGFPADSEEVMQYIFVDLRGNIFCRIKNAEDTLSADFSLAYVYISARNFTSADESEFIPSPASLVVASAYPNPFNPVTSLPVELSRSSTVALKIFNSMGQLMSENSFELAPGSHLLPINGSAWASGNYFAKVSSGDFSQTKKMILLK